MNSKSLKTFKLNEEGSFSITKPYESNQIIQIIKSFIGDLSNLVITDATACMGGDLVNFSKYCRFVNGVEIDNENFELLMENCKRFGCLNVNLFCQDYLEIYDKLRQDIIYMDPPWGGIGYKYKESVTLKIGDIELSQLVKNIREKYLAKYLFIKVPSNVCLESIEYEDIKSIFNKSKSESFKLIVIKITDW